MRRRGRPSWRPLLDDWLGHRLRRLRARPAGLLHADDLVLADGRLVLTYGSPDSIALALGQRRAAAATAFPNWRDRCLLPALIALADCHADGAAGFVPVDGRWVQPVDWFLRASPVDDSGARRRADLRHAARWLASERALVPRPDEPRDARMVDALARALDAGDALVSTLRADLREMSRAQRESPAPPSFLALLTEAELLERLSRVYRFRRLAAAEVQALGHDPRRDTIIELDASWKDHTYRANRRDAQPRHTRTDICGVGRLARLAGLQGGSFANCSYVQIGDTDPSAVKLRKIISRLKVRFYPTSNLQRHKMRSISGCHQVVVLTERSAGWRKCLCFTCVAFEPSLHE